MDKPKRLLKVGEVLNRVGLSRSQLYRMMSWGDFPKPVHVTPRRVAWIDLQVKCERG